MSGQSIGNHLETKQNPCGHAYMYVHRRFNVGISPIRSHTDMMDCIPCNISRDSRPYIASYRLNLYI